MTEAATCLVSHSRFLCIGGASNLWPIGPNFLSDFFVKQKIWRPGLPCLSGVGQCMFQCLACPQFGQFFFCFCFLFCCCLFVCFLEISTFIFIMPAPICTLTTSEYFSPSPTCMKVPLRKSTLHDKLGWRI